MELESAGRIFKTILDPQLVTLWWGIVAVFALMGYASLRVLRKQPDFPQKPQLVWGARWFWALMAGALSVQGVITYLGDDLGGSQFGLCSGGYFALVWIVFVATLLPSQVNGPALWIIAALIWIRKRPVERVSLFDEHERSPHNRWCKAPLPGIMLVTVAMAGYLTAQLSPMERSLCHTRQYAVVAAAVREHVDKELVVKVVAGERVIFHELAVWIRVRQETTPEQATALADQAKQALAVQSRPDRWEIRVYARDKGILATGEYLLGPDQP